MSSDGSDTERSQRSQRPSRRLSKCARVSTDAEHPAMELCRVGVRIPPFWPEKPNIWFCQVEGQFKMARITDDSTKFYYVLAQLDRQHSEEVEDIITSPPPTDKYEKLKSELIKRLSVSREKKVKQLLQSEELGDRKPSQFLRHLQNLAGPTIPEDFLRTMWTSRLPSNLQTIVASQLSLSLAELADLADRVHDIAPASPHVAAASTSRPDPQKDMMSLIMELTTKVDALTTEGHSRSRPRTRQTSGHRSRTPSRRSQSDYRRFPSCWYHHKFGSRAKKCIRPCDYKAGNEQGSR
ncbi:hypothetical protein PYW07_006251 [Mythimna separata]|uniref:DUF7041 domain-containing protein n=1 Tax=Mythimna separata TaxID=271217 RepID=A0AAD8DWD3_MYTSE|nr:hypothetical protein PYW07_006251 [Mythimna separata]